MLFRSPGFVSENLDISLVDDVETVPLEAAERECRRLASEEGILVGQSSGATAIVARRVAKRIAEPESEHENENDHDDGPLVVTVFWDSGERYVSTGMFDA